jgi:predicted nuclease of predicted toxin-antitoxin system
LIRLFLDQALPLRAEAILRERGWDVIHATTAGVARAADNEIVTWCSERRYSIVTHDHGFHQIIALAEASGPSVIRIRLQGLNHEEIAKIVDKVARTHTDMLDSGCLISVSGQRVRVRMLPLGGNLD